MVIHRKAGRLLLVVALTTAPSIGCKSGFSFPSWNPFAKPAQTPGSPMLQGDGDGGYIQAPQPQMAPPEPRAEEFGWTTTPFKKLGDTISSPFKKSADAKPKPVTAEDDPISLTSKQAPAGAKLYISLAQLQLKAGNVDSAIDQYQKAIEAEPKSLPALLGIAHVYDSKGDTAKALEYYKKAVAAHENSPAAHNDLGLCYYRDKKPTESVVALKRAIELDQTKALYRNNLAKILVETDRAEEAYRILVGVHGEAVAHYNVGFMLNDRGLKAQALEHFRSAAKLDPTLKPAQHWVNILSGNEAQGRLATAAPAATAPVPTTLRAAAPASAGQAAAAPVARPAAVATNRYPAAPPATALPSASATPAPASANVGPRYSQVSTPIGNSRDAAPAADGPQQGDGELTKSGAASVLAAARAVAASPLSGGPDNSARSKVVPLKTVTTPTSSPVASTNPSLETPIPSPIVVPGRAEPRISVDNRPTYSNELPAAGPATSASPQATTPLPAPEEEEGPRLGKKQRKPDASLVGDRYATGSRYTTGNAAAAATAPIQPPRGAVPPLPEQFSRTGSTGTTQGTIAAGDAKATPEPAARPATASRYPASRY